MAPPSSGITGGRALPCRNVCINRSLNGRRISVQPRTNRTTLASVVLATSSRSPSPSPESSPGPGTTSVRKSPAPEVQNWFFTETGQKGWVEAMELDTLTPDMPMLLKEMGIKYDPDRLSDVLSTRWARVYGRALKIAGLLGGFIASIAQDSALGKLESNAPQRAGELRDVLSRLGPSFVKIGQALSARPDLLPKAYLDALSDLQDKLPSFPSDIARTVIADELGAPVEELFATFTAEPVAAASLGQVYRATLRSNGEEVAVKVQRPSIGESIAVDMLLLRRLMGVVDRTALPALGISQPLVPLVDEFASRLFAELDYVQEGKNCERFQALYGAMPRVRTPRIKWQHTSRRVLTMEWIEGVKLTNKEAMDAAGLSVVDFVDVGIECTLRQLLEHGYFHADPHPGNLLATTSGDLVYLDFGMMSEAPQYARYAIMSHVVHLVNRDYDAMCKDYYTLQFMDPSVDTSPIAPALAAFFDDVLDASVSQLNFKAIVDGLGEVLFRYPFRVPAYYALILRSLTVLEGLALQADRNYKLLGRAYPYMARRLLTDPAPELRESFEDLILKDGAFRWSRLENLLREGSKSQDFDPSQLWLLAEWLLSPPAAGVRTSVVAECARMVDAMAAGDVRNRIVQRFGSYTVAERLVPPQPQEAEALARANLLIDSLRARITTTPTPALATSTTSTTSSGSQQAGSRTGLSSSQVSPPAPRQVPAGGNGGAPSSSSSTTSALADVFDLQGSGPFGMLTPGDVQAVVARLQHLSTDALPRLSGLLAQPGARDLVQEMTGQLARRFTARAIKLAFGSQALLTGGAGSASSSSSSSGASKGAF